MQLPFYILPTVGIIFFLMSISFTFSYNGIIVPLHSTSHPLLLPFPYLIEYAGFFLVLY